MEQQQNAFSIRVHLGEFQQRGKTCFPVYRSNGTSHTDVKNPVRQLKRICVSNSILESEGGGGNKLLEPSQ